MSQTARRHAERASAAPSHSIQHLSSYSIQRLSSRRAQRLSLKDLDTLFFTNLDQALHRSALNASQLKGIADALRLSTEGIYDRDRLISAILHHLKSVKSQYAPHLKNLAWGGASLAVAYYFVSLVSWMDTLSSRYIHRSNPNHVHRFVSASTETTFREQLLLWFTPPIYLFVTRVGFALFGSYVILSEVLKTMFQAWPMRQAQAQSVLLEAIRKA